jgi:hypothetical protein
MGHGSNDGGTLNDKAAEAIESLRAQGCAVTDSDVCRLNALAWHIETPQLQRELSRGRPVQCGNVWLWPLSLAAQDWYLETGERFAKPLFALAYAMAHSHDEALDTATQRDVLRWARRIRATRAQVQTCIAQVLTAGEKDEEPVAAKDVPSCGHIASVLAACCGGSPKDWERNCSFDYARRFLTLHFDQQQADGKSGISPEVARAERAFGWAINRIGKRGKAAE